MTKTILTDNLSVPLNEAKTAKVNIDSGTGNLTIDRLTASDGVLATGTLEYIEEQGPPTHSVSSDQGQTVLAVRGEGGRRSWFRLPWDACGGGAFDWQVHLNPNVLSDITAHSGGGNVKVHLAGMAVTRVTADTGGGNMELVLPDHAANLCATAKTGAGNVNVEVGSGITGTETIEAHSGAGNVVVHVPRGIAARIHTSSGLGKVVVDPQFSMIDKDTYQSPDYDGAANRVEITAHSGAGNVMVGAK